MKKSKYLWVIIHKLPKLSGKLLYLSEDFVPKKEGPVWVSRLEKAMRFTSAQKANAVLKNAKVEGFDGKTKKMERRVK